MGCHDLTSCGACCSECLQDDNFIPALSAAECLVFYAAMLLPKTSAAAQQTGITSRTLGHRRHQSCQHNEAVQHVLDVVGLSKHASTMVRKLLLCRRLAVISVLLAAAALNQFWLHCTGCLPFAMQAI